MQRPCHHRRTETKRQIRRHEDHGCHCFFHFRAGRIVGADSREAFQSLSVRRVNFVGLEKVVLAPHRNG